MRGEVKERLAGTAIRSITQPLLVLSLGFGLPTVALAHFLTGVALFADLGLAAFFPILFGLTHVYFMFKDPDRLQSEDYRLRDRSLTLVESGKGLLRDPELLVVSTSPIIKSLATEALVVDERGENMTADIDQGVSAEARSEQ